MWITNFVLLVFISFWNLKLSIDKWAKRGCFIWILISNYIFLTSTQNDPKKCSLSLFKNASLLVAFLLNSCVYFYIIFFFLPITYSLCRSVGSLALILMPEIITEMDSSFFVRKRLSQGIFKLTDSIDPLTSINGIFINWESSCNKLVLMPRFLIVNPSIELDES